MTLEKKDTYYFSTWDIGMAYDLLDIQPHQVYQTDEKGLFYLLKEIIDCPDSFVEVHGQDGCSIPIQIDTDLKKIVEVTREFSGYDDPETFSPPKTEPKEEEKEVFKFVNHPKPISLTGHNSSSVTTEHYLQPKKAEEAKS
jgi:hypothetical protein